MNINNEYVSLKTAELAKEVGFNLQCSCYYNDSCLITNGEVIDDYIDDGRYLRYNEGMDFNTEGKYDKLCNYNVLCSAPTLFGLDAWLLENHHLQITIFSQSQESWQFHITQPHQKLEDTELFEDYNSKEEAWDNALYIALTMIKEQLKF